MSKDRPELEVQEAWNELVAQLAGDIPEQEVVGDIPEQEVVVECLEALLFGAYAGEYPVIIPVRKG